VKACKSAQLAGAPFLLLKDGHCFRQNVVAMFERARVEPRITFESGCFLTILNMIKAGMGISVVPEMAVQNGSGCKFNPVESDQPVRIISLIQLQSGRPTLAQELLANFIKRSHSF
jgi:LysR family hydrogen peroxide-inducible transcriptional activator